MPVSISRLRRWFAVSAIALTVLVAGVYFYARWRVRDVLKEVPGKIGIEVQQSAEGFTVSKSEQGRTLFKVQASKAIQYKQGGLAELHDVTITLYGRDSSRFDQIYGATFDYDPRSGDVASRGEVQIDLEANPEGLIKPDQTPPKELKNPIHLKTTNLVFNQKTGNASTKEKVDFRIPQATGSAVAASYDGKTQVLTLGSQVQVVFAGSTPATVTAAHATMRKNPGIVLLQNPHVVSGSETMEAEQGTLFLRPDNTLERVLAEGNVQIQTQGVQPTHSRSDQLEVFMNEQPRDTIRNAVFTGNVQLDANGAQPIHGSSGKAVVDFYGKNLVGKIHTEENVKLRQVQKPASPTSNAQDMELASTVVDFFLADGRRLKSAETSGAAQITIKPANAGDHQQSVITAGKFKAGFDALGQISSMHGAPDARIVSSNSGQPDRVSTSNTLDASFRPGSGIETLVQQGNLVYVDGERKAWADRGRYTPADQMLLLSGAPRVQDGGMTTTARGMKLNRATGDAFADGDVKSTYSDLKAQPDGALLASSSPIHVTARSMTAHRTPSVALYTGDARLWQDANVVEAPSIQFDRNQRSIVAQGSTTVPVSTVFVQIDSSGKVVPVTITSDRLTYTDEQRKAHFEGGVIAKSADATITSKIMDVFLQPRGESAANSAATASLGKLDHIVAQGQVVIIQPNRRGTGETLTYTAAEDKYVLTGGPPSIFDAEHGKITGVSLTFYRHDDRVVVEGNASSPTESQTRVAR